MINEKDELLLTSRLDSGAKTVNLPPQRILWMAFDFLVLAVLVIVFG